MLLALAILARASGAVASATRRSGRPRREAEEPADEPRARQLGAGVAVGQHADSLECDHDAHREQAMPRARRSSLFISARTSIPVF
jgi:hypothetical protein